MIGFYATEVENLENILDNGIRADADGLVHLATEKANAGPERGFRAGGPVAIVFAVEVSDEAVQPHAEHIIHRGDIPRPQVGPVVRILGNPLVTVERHITG